MLGNAWLAFGILIAVVILEKVIASIILACACKYYDWQDRRAK
ncbi:putative membrane protein [Propionispora sp. 2/2-37]|nr:hypothetical protein [Propionispora sp. 2/2-37]CUH97369.1 putative membrane protein [Propionispora sp. 2/2-37]